MLFRSMLMIGVGKARRGKTTLVQLQHKFLYSVIGANNDRSMNALHILRAQHATGELAHAAAKIVVRQDAALLL